MKIRPLLAFCLALVLTSCQAQATPAPIASATPGATAATLALPAVTPTAAQTAVPAGCTVISPRPTPGPTEESLFPPVRESDWVEGPFDAPVTLLEYSDFM